MTSDRPLSLAITWNGRAITHAAVDEGRAARPSRLLEGRPVDEALAIVPRLFGVCRRSHEAAARMACALAASEEADDAAAAFGELQVLAESALESLWRVMLDWPALCGQAPRTGAFAALRIRIVSLLPTREDANARESWPRIAGELERFLEESVLGQPPASFGAATFEGWRHASRTQAARIVNELMSRPSPSSGVPLLPWLDRDALRREIAPAIDRADDFEGAPRWRGEPAETGAFARQSSDAGLQSIAATHRNAARFVARLVELARIPALMRSILAGTPGGWIRGVRLSPGAAIAAVETARGSLLHDVRLDRTTVARWRIAAPTEWNFHPDGAFVRELRGSAASSEAAARQSAERLACALDPCVAWQVTVGHA